MPTEGPFVVIAAETLSVGFEALPEIESKLRSLDVFSAWRAAARPARRYRARWF
jgi:hypothetical protein